MPQHSPSASAIVQDESENTTGDEPEQSETLAKTDTNLPTSVSSQETEMSTKLHEQCEQVEPDESEHSDSTILSSSEVTAVQTSTDTEPKVTDTEPKLDRLDDLCRICMDSLVDCLLLECGHMVTCTQCGKRLSDCPICRQYVVRVVRVFRS